MITSPIYFFFSFLLQGINKIVEFIISSFDCTSDGNLIINGFSDIDDEFARECAYKIYFSKNKCQEELLDNILTYRCKLAQKCGFSTYAERLEILHCLNNTRVSLILRYINFIFFMLNLI